MKLKHTQTHIRMRSQYEVPAVWHVEHHGQAIDGFWLEREGRCGSPVTLYPGVFNRSEVADLQQQLEKVGAWLAAAAALDNSSSSEKPDAG